MAGSPPDIRRLLPRTGPVLLTGLLLAGLNPGGAAAAPLPDADLPISLDADSSEFDRRNNLVTFQNVQITQGEVGIAADSARATGLDFENSRWMFNGHVSIDLPSGRIQADEATVEFADHQLRVATILGAPASFEHRDSEAERLARGRANEIVYDVGAGTVTLKEDAWLSEGENEISGGTLVYDIADERVVANGSGVDQSRVRVVIAPRNNGEAQPDGNQPGGTTEQQRQ